MQKKKKKREKTFLPLLLYFQYVSLKVNLRTLTFTSLAKSLSSNCYKSTTETVDLVFEFKIHDILNLTFSCAQKTSHELFNLKICLEHRTRI